jgi:hypothetical protein
MLNADDWNYCGAALKVSKAGHIDCAECRRGYRTSARDGLIPAEEP